MIAWYCKKHYTWSDGKSLPDCVLYRLKKGSTSKKNNCIYVQRYKPDQLLLFADKKKYDTKSGAVTEIANNVLPGQLKEIDFDLWVNAYQKNRLLMYNLCDIIYSIDATIDLYDILAVAGTNPTADTIVQAIEYLIKIKSKTGVFKNDSRTNLGRRTCSGTKRHEKRKKQRRKPALSK